MYGMAQLSPKDAARQAALPLAASSEALRHHIAAATPRDRKTELGQFMTPEPVARFMAAMFRPTQGPYALLDPGAGLGALATAALDRWSRGELGNGKIHVVAHEIDPRLRLHLAEVLARYRGDRGAIHIAGGDYLASAVEALEAGRREYSHAILNPPYKKIATTSEARLLCRRAGLETVNLYSAFVGLALAQLRAWARFGAPGS